MNFCFLEVRFYPKKNYKMKIISNWELFLESLRRDPEDKVDLFKITTNFVPGENYNAYSVMKGQNEEKCKSVHSHGILSKKSLIDSRNIESDEKFFHQYVRDWIMETGSSSASVDKISQRLEVKKINKKKNPETGQWENTTDKLTRKEANELKAMELKKDPNSFKAKIPFVQSNLPKIKQQDQIKFSPFEVMQKQKTDKKFHLLAADSQKLKNLFQENFIEFYKAGEEDDNYAPLESDQIAYWSGIYEELFGILKSGSWIWSRSGRPEVITDRDNKDFNLNLKMNPNIFAQQLKEIEFDRKRKLEDSKEWSEFDLNQLTVDEEEIKNFLLADRKSVLLRDGSVRVSISRPRLDSDKIRLIFQNKGGKKLSVSSLVKHRGGGFTISFREGPKSEELNTSMVNKIINFIDSDAKKITLGDYVIVKDEKLPYRTIPAEFVELYDFLLMNYQKWRASKGMEPF